MAIQSLDFELCRSTDPRFISLPAINIVRPRRRRIFPPVSCDLRGGRTSLHNCDPERSFGGEKVSQKNGESQCLGAMTSRGGATFSR